MKLFLSLILLLSTSQAFAAGAKVTAAWCQHKPVNGTALMRLATVHGNFSGTLAFGVDTTDRLSNCTTVANGLNDALRNYRVKAGAAADAPVTVVAFWCEANPSDGKIMSSILTEMGVVQGILTPRKDVQSELYNCKQQSDGINDAIVNYQRIFITLSRR